MNSIFSIALLVLITGATNAHAGYYHRVPSSGSGRHVPSPDRDQGEYLQEHTQGLTDRQKMQNEMYRQRMEDEVQRSGEIWPGSETFH